MSEAVTQDIYISGMHCDACEKTITRSLQRIGVNVEDIRYSQERVEVRYDPGLVPFGRIREAVADVGYHVTDSPRREHQGSFFNMVREIQKEFVGNASAFVVEKQMIKSTLATLAVVALLTYLLYFVFFWDTETFWQDYGRYIVYLVISVVATGGAVKHLRAYRGAVSCMTGMMIGMTIGMISSLLLGTLIGATNGMFMGSVFGMVFGMAVGAWVGSCCGIMGIMEGMMAGLMGGVMGPMISVMMIADRLDTFIPIFLVACLMILGGLSYLVYKEHKHMTGDVRPYGFWPYTLANFAIVFVGIVVMVWGPRAAFLQ